MEITQVRVFPVGEARLKAFVSVVFDHCFVVSDIKVIQGPDRLFVSMPSKRQRDGSFRDIAHPLNSETRNKFEEQIIQRYLDMQSHSEAEREVPRRSARTSARLSANEDRAFP